jgi:hypothetical protein
MHRSALAGAALLLALGLGCGPARGALDTLRGPAPTPTASWVGGVRVEGERVDSYMSRIAEVDELTAKPLTVGVALREAPGRGAEPNGVSIGPGERVFLVAVVTIGSERFFQVRSFDGLRRGWLAESALAPQARPPRVEG